MGCNSLLTTLFPLQFARQFYVAQWYRDANVEVEKLTKQQQAPKTTKDPDELAEELERIKDATEKAERRKQALFHHINTRKIRAFSSYK